MTESETDEAFVERVENTKLMRVLPDDWYRLFALARRGAEAAARIEKLEEALREISELRWSPGKTTYQELLADAQYTARSHWESRMSEIDIIDCVSLPTLQAFAKKAMEENASLRARIEKLEAALTPSADTKAAYIGEFHFTDEGCRKVAVPWTTVKEIMAAIRALGKP